MVKVDKLEFAGIGLDETSRVLTELDFSFSPKFSNRRDKIVNEIDAFAQAIERQLIPAKKQIAKVAALSAQLKMLKQELE